MVIGLRLVDLGVLDRPSEPRAELVAADRVNAARKAGRADIVDRNGVLLATSLKTASLFADPVRLNDPEGAARDLAELFPDLSFEELRKKLQSKKRFVWIRRNLTPKQQYAAHRLGYPGLEFRNEYRRVYPHGNLFAHVLGYTDIDNKGLAGIEKSHEAELIEAAAPLTTTLDVRIQSILHDALSASMADFSAEGGAGIVMDARSGAVLAAVSLPDFDPHFPGAAPAKARFSRISLGVFEMGSTFKLFSTAAALETGEVRVQDKFDARKPLREGRYLIRDYHAQNRILTLPEVFIHSSNIGTALMAREIGTERLRDFFTDIGMVSPVPVDLPETGAPLAPRPWRDINTLTASYGHGIAVSALHVARAGAAMVNGGRLPLPHLVAGDDADGENTAGPRVISPKTSRTLRQLMRLVVVEGTGSNAEVAGYRVGGKTGTAEKIRADGKGYDSKSLVSSFLGAFPMDDPRYVVFVVLDEPRGNAKSHGYATGGWVAAPVVADVIRQMAPLVGLAPDENAGADLHGAVMRYLSPKGRNLASN